MPVQSVRAAGADTAASRYPGPSMADTELVDSMPPQWYPISGRDRAAGCSPRWRPEHQPGCPCERNSAPGVACDDQGGR